MGESDREIAVDLPWDVTCRLACMALIQRKTLNDLMVQALVERMDRLDRERAAQKGKR